jgi:Fur family peroxide stress response transcriptional regulator
MKDPLSVLRDHAIQATPQRIAVMRYVCETDSHPSADEVLENVRRHCPTVSRSTVYNTLNLLVEKGLLRTQVLKGGTVVFDCKVKPHHHFIDQETGRIYDVAWDAVKVTGHESLKGFDVEEHQVIMRGRRKKR